jgi:glycosidase
MALPPLVLEINTRCWLRELTDMAGSPVTLQNVPPGEFERWRALGFSHIWLMGVWTTGPLSRAVALAQPDLRDLCIQSFGCWDENDIAASPYAIADYSVPRALGGDAGLQNFRDALHHHGLKLLLDFVPNHTGLDHPWLQTHPERFVSFNTRTPGTFPGAGRRWIAHGKDPWFPPWADTAQL